jgi:enoyl-CoA hydratase / 3-hydroxyacyl-CoA dehydrogenase
MSTVDPQLADRVALKAFAEACMVLEEGIAGVRDIDLGMMMGTGMIPGPFARADLRGLDEVLTAMETTSAERGDAFEPPLLLRRLVAQGRLGAKSGQGFYPYPQTSEQGAVKLELRGETAIAWLDNPPANSISAAVIDGLAAAWQQIEERGVRAMVLASPNPALFCAGADIKAFTKMDAAAGEQLLDSVHELLRSWERSRVVTIAAVNGLAFGGGCELAMACDVRIAGASATFGQPEVNLGIIPGFGGTQRLPRLVGQSKALEMNLTGDAVSADDAYQHGLVNRVVADHELFDEALSWARKLGGQAPVAVEQIKRASTAAGLDDGIEAEKRGFAAAFGSEDAREGIGAFLEKRRPNWQAKHGRSPSR